MEITFEVWKYEDVSSTYRIWMKVVPLVLWNLNVERFSKLQVIV